MLNPITWWRGFLNLQDRAASRVAEVGERISLARTPREGIPGSTSAVRLERFTLWVRFTAFVVAALVLPLFGVTELLPVYLLVGAFGLYTVCISRVLIPHKPEWLEGGYVLFTVDSIMVGTAVGLTGGMNSAFTVCYLPLIVVHSLRYGAMHLLFAPVLSIVTLTGGVLLAGSDEGQLARMAFWDFWIVVTALISGMLVERGRRAEANLAAELRHTQALLEAAHAPAASLTVEGVLAATLAGAQSLTQADVVGVQLYGGRRQPAVYRERVDDGPGTDAFRQLVRSDFRARQALVNAGRPIAPVELNGARSNVHGLDSFTSMCAAVIRSQRGAQGLVAIARRTEPPLGQVELDALEAFLERAALAIQNARLYEQVQSQLDELRTLHGNMIRADRLAAVGELAAKVAHELNNPLTSILLYNSLLLEQPVEAAEQRNVAQLVVDQVERARRVIRNILDYSRANPLEIDTVRVDDLLERGISLVAHAAEVGGVQVHTEFSVSVAQIRADPAHLTQVFINLLLNAIHAMPQGGYLFVETGMEGNEVCVRISDNGTGIAPEDLERIFDPFFTTKPAEEGTGLGLAVSRTLVSQHGGRITVDSEVGKGSVFTVWLPLAPVQPEVVLAR